jgi:hypothetical protein
MDDDMIRNEFTLLFYPIGARYFISEKNIISVHCSHVHLNFLLKLKGRKVDCERTTQSEE